MFQIYKIILNIFLLLGSTYMIAQNGDPSILPNITPPSPESFMYTQYGKNSISEFNGKVNLSIPIYNFTSGNLNLPITLNYSGAGVKVNDISTWTGINWNLITGGVINRTINDSADESNQTTRKFINYNDLITNVTSNCQPNSQEYINIMEYNDVFYDTEIDEWSFNFNGYSGSFYFDENFNPIYIENEKEIKIEVVGNGITNLEKFRDSSTFLITTADGIQYYFGGVDCEQTMLFSGHRGASSLHNTTFYLNKIIHPIKGDIILEYYTDQAALIHYSRTYQMSTTGGGITEYSIPAYTSILTTNQINNPKFLKKIKSTQSNEEIVFNITTFNNHNYLASLQNIEIYNSNTLLKKIDFTYTYPLNVSNTWGVGTDLATRFFLKKIEFNTNSSNNANKEVYQFDYESPDLMPSRLSPSQDILGYFNNKPNSTTIPKPSYFRNVDSDSFGDLTPDFNFAKRGSLSKVTYPTGGYSVFEYEPIKAKKKIFNDYTLSVIGGSIATIPGDNGLSEEVVSFQGVYEDQTVVIKIQTGISEVEGVDSEMVYQSFHNSRAELKIIDVTASTAPIVIKKSLGMFSQNALLVPFDFKKNHQYQIELKLINVASNSYSTYISANAEFQIFNGFEVVNGFGVRVKNQKDYANDDSFSNYKRYYYKNINSLNDNFYALSEINLFPKFTFTFDNNPENFFGYYLNIFSQPSGILSNTSLIETFDVVTISEGGDNFENGGTEKFFLKDLNEGNTKIQVEYDGCWVDWEVVDHPINCGLGRDKKTGVTLVREKAYTDEKTKLDYFNGKLIMERNFINKNNSLYKNKEVFYNYSIIRKLLNNAVNFIGRDLFEINVGLHFCPENPEVPIRGLGEFFMAYYFIETFDVKLNNVVSKEYIEPIPLNLNIPLFTGVDQSITEDYFSHDLTFKKIITTQNYEYGTLRGLPTVVTTNTSDSSVVNKTVNTYLNTASSLSGIPGNQTTMYTNLISQNRVGSPVQVQQFKNAELLSTQRTLFNDFTVNSLSKILPEKIQVNKGEQPLEDKAIFYNYDEHFNPVVIGNKDAPKTRYMFNTEGLVVAKIENYTGTSTTFPLITGNIDNTSCSLQTEYPNSDVTVFKYNLITKKIIQTTDARCQNTFYEYDDLQRLKLIKDHDGNIVKEFDQQFKPQD